MFGSAVAKKLARSDSFGYMTRNMFVYDDELDESWMKDRDVACFRCYRTCVALLEYEIR